MGNADLLIIDNATVLYVIRVFFFNQCVTNFKLLPRKLTFEQSEVDEITLV